VEEAYLGVGERLDLILDFAGVAAGRRVILKSLPFSLPTGNEVGFPQGMELDLLRFERVAGAGPSVTLPGTLTAVPPLGPPARGRTFALTSEEGASHRINRASFEMERIDYRIPLGEVEQWEFFNNSVFPHPVHVHGTQFQVVARTGGRGRVFPYEAGWKDTALVFPFETVVVLVRFEHYPGLFPLHCHNLEHEDMGMMLNVEVTA
jgi:FtsP/CotA-like multicopper oxidase with cupredoxin domain